jgi:hypothetical protein
MVAQGITSTGGADFIITKLLGTPKDTMLAQARMGRRWQDTSAAKTQPADPTQLAAALRACDVIFILFCHCRSACAS